MVAYDVYPNRMTMTLDDSSGLTIDIFCRKEMSNGHTTNTTVDCHGTINLNNGSKPVDEDHTYTTKEGYKVDLKDIDIGSVVKVKGGINEFRGEKQLTLERISLVRTTNEEASAWAENSTFYKDILSKPWVVSERRQQQARIEAEGVKREREARKERKRKKKAPEEKQERNGREKKSRGGERKREEHRAKDASQTQGFVKTARLNGATGLKQIFRRAATGNFDALGL